MSFSSFSNSIKLPLALIAALATTLSLGVACGGEQNSTAGTPAGPVADLGQADAVFNADTAASKIYWKGSKLYQLDSHNGTINLSSGKLGFKAGAPIAGSFVIDMNSIANLDIENPEYNAKLVGHLKNEDFFAVDQHPTAKFEIGSVTAAGENQYEVSGNLTIRGLTRGISGPATIIKSENGVKIAAELKIDRTQYGIEYNSESAFADLARDKIIDDQIEIKLDIQLQG